MNWNNGYRVPCLSGVCDDAAFAGAVSRGARSDDSLANLIGADFRVPCLEYQEIHKVTRLLTGNQTEVRQLYRLMVFNVLAHNRDDHAKNFAFLYQPETGWRLAPGFDLTYADGPGGEHTTTIAGEGRAPGPAQFQRVAEVAGLSASDAAQIVTQVRDAVNQWSAFARASGVCPATVARIGKDIGR